MARAGVAAVFLIVLAAAALASAQEIGSAPAPSPSMDTGAASGLGAVSGPVALLYMIGSAVAPLIILWH